MKKKFNLAKIACFVMLLTVTAMILVAGTYAKYSSSASGTDATVVAKWSFMVGQDDITTFGSDDKITFDLFNTIYDTVNDEEETDVADGLIAPGTKGAFEFALRNTSEVTVKYDIKLEVTKGANVPLQFSIDGGQNWTNVADLSDLVATDVMRFGTDKNVTIMWQWLFEGTTDATLGGQDVEVTASIIATQVDNSDIDQDEAIIAEKELFPDLESLLRTSTPSTSAIQTIAPFYYQDVELFENKNITEISMYVKSVTYSNDYAIMNISTLVAPSSFVVGAAVPTDFLETYTVKLPKSYFENATSINKWIDIDLTQYAYKSNGELASNGIEVGDGETIAISSKGKDTIVWNVDTGTLSTQSFYYNNSGKLAYSADNGLYFLFKYKDVSTVQEKEDSLKTLLNGKKLSVLGDSISTYQGVSNNTSYNSTIGSNSVYYGNIDFTKSLTQDETYWQQIIDKYNMNLNVNNSWSGGTVTGIKNTNKATSRANQLHNNNDEKPDVIIVYVGINDLRYKQTAELFEEGYTTMLNTIKTNYPDANVFCVSMPNRNGGNDYENGLYTDEEATAFNNSIKNSITATNGNFYYVDLFNSEYKDEVYFNNSMNIGTQNQYTNSTLDNLHPNEIGMDYMTEIISNAMRDALVK